MTLDDHTVLILGGCGGPNLVSMVSLFLILGEQDYKNNNKLYLLVYNVNIINCSRHFTISQKKKIGTETCVNNHLPHMGLVCFWLSFLVLSLRGFSLTTYSCFPLSSSHSLFLLLPIYYLLLGGLKNGGRNYSV